MLTELEPFVKNEQITGILYTLKSGKEATVYCCEAHPSTGKALLAAKVYKSPERRDFRNDGSYREGRWIPTPNMRRAVAAKNSVGREFQFSTWVGHEFRTLSTLHAAGADVPEPIASTPGAILMEYLGDEDGPAPLLRKVRLDPDEAEVLLGRLIHNLGICLQNNRVHADLSPFNVLYWNDKPTIIDFPQSVDPRLNAHAYDLLLRDVTNICKYFNRFGVVREPMLLTDSLWRDYAPL